MRDGYLFAPSGRIINFEHVARFVQEFANQHNVKLLAFDTAMMDRFDEACKAIGLDTHIVGQDAYGGGLAMQRHSQGWGGHTSATALWMPRSICELESAIVNRQIRIRRNPVLRWGSASAVTEPDPTGNRKWDKKKATGRIDTIVAASMAVGAAIAIAPAPPTSIWDRPELWEKEDGAQS